VLTIGTGGVALFALQFAKLFEANTFAITSTDKKMEFLKRLGADHVINYKQNPDWHMAIRDLTGGRGIDHVVETGSLESLPKSLLTRAWNALVVALTGGSLDVSLLCEVSSMRAASLSELLPHSRR